MSELNLLLPGDEDKAAQRMTERMKLYGVSSEDINKMQSERRTFIERMEALSPDELRQIDDLASKIDIHDPKIAAEYALSAQGKMNNLADSSLKGVTGREIGDVGELIVRMAVAMRTFNDDFNNELDRKPKGFSFLRKARRDLEQAKQRVIVMYGDVLKTLDDAAKGLGAKYEMLSKDQDTQEQLYDHILDYFKELTAYILAAKKALDATVKGELAELQKTADETGDPKDAQAFQDCQSDCSRFEKRIYDLELTRQICLQNLPQIRMIQGMNCDLMQQIISTVNNSIPLWKQGIVVGLSLTHSKNAAEAVNTMSVLTGEMLKTNARTLGAVGTETARRSEMGYINPKDILECNAILIKAIDDITEVHRKGLEERNKMRKCMAEGEAELAIALKQAYTKSIEEWAVA